MRLFYLFVVAFGSLFSGEVNSSEDKICVVFVSDHNFFAKFKETYNHLRKEGMYRGDVCLIATGALKTEREKKFCEKNGIHYLEFPEIGVSEEHKRCAFSKSKAHARIQKFHVFNTYFKTWDYLFYIDVGMKIHGDVNKIIEKREKGVILAPGDLNIAGHIPREFTYEFKDEGTEAYKELVRKYGLTNQYLRSTTMLFDTSIIDEHTVDDLVGLFHSYPFGKGDQTYISLYFIQIKPRWKPMVREDEDMDYYDFCPRGPGRVYIMHKYHMLPHKCPLCSRKSAIIRFD